MGIVNDPSRVPPLRAVVRALAKAGASAGIGLSLDGEKIRFFHRSANPEIAAAASRCGSERCAMKEHCRMGLRRAS